MSSLPPPESTSVRKKRLEECLQAAEPYEDDDPAGICGMATATLTAEDSLTI